MRLRTLATAAAALALALPPLTATADQAAVVAGTIATFGRHLHLSPGTALDFTAVSGEYCFDTGLGRGGHMTHYAVDPASRANEHVIDFVDARPLIDAGLDVDELPAHPGGLDTMEPHRWYHLAAGEFDPHHGRTFPFPLLLRASTLD